MARAKRTTRISPRGAYYHENWYDWPDLNLELDAQEHSANDFFGGDLRGIEEKLPYIESLGVTVLYLNPIFRSPSNHKYDTGDYLQIDPSFGTEEDLRSLCAAAKKRGIRVILDGVFSHTGADSVYFNKYGTYGERRRARTAMKRAPTAPGTASASWPKDYDCWWGFTTLPNVNEMDKSYRAFINGEDGVAAHWIKRRHLRLAAGRGGRIADALSARAAPPREERPDERGGAAGRGLGRPDQQDRLRRGALLLRGRHARQRDELSPARGGAGVFHLQDRRLCARAAHRGHAREHAAHRSSIR